MANVQKIIKTAAYDSIKKMRSFRFISAVMMVVGLVLAVTSGMDQLIGDVNEKVSIWIVPHIFSNTFFAAFYGIIICYLLSDIPYFNANELYYISRMGRKKWFMEKMLSMILSMFMFTIISFAVCVLVFVPKINFTMEWGKVIHTMAYSTNLYSYNLMNLVSPSILMNYKPITAMETCFLMVWLVSVMVGCVMSAISIWFNRTVSIVVVLMLSLLGLSEGLFFTQRWLPFLSIFTWYRISVYGETIFMDWQYPKQYVYVILIICIMCLSFFAAYRRIRHTEFDWINET